MPTPTPSPTPSPTPDPPRITCPAALTTQSLDGNPVAASFSSPSVTNGQAPLTTTCTPPSGSSFVVGQTTVTCRTTDALERTDSCTFVVTIQPPPRLTVTSFVGFGDSITWGEDGRNSAVTASLLERNHPRVQLPLDQVYPSVLQALLVARYRTQAPTVANEGQPGEAVTDADTLSRFSRIMATRQYQAVLIMEGTNDLADRDDRVYPAVIAGLRQMILDAKSRNIRPYLATIPPMDPRGFRGLAWTLVPGLNTLIRSLATQENVTLVDIYAAFDDINTEIGFDGLHPTAAGYRRIAETFSAAIKATLEAPAVSSTTLAPASRTR